MSLLFRLSLLTTALAAVGPAFAQGPSPAPSRAPSAPAAGADAPEPPVLVHAIRGEITDLAASSFKIRPWQYQLPARLLVTAAPGTRYLKQSEGKQRDLQVGDLALVVPEEAPLHPKKPFYVVRKPNRQQDPPKKIPEARAVLRLWHTDVADPKPDSVSADDRRNAHVLLDGAAPLFRGVNRGGVDRPVKKEKVFTGIVTALQPLSIQTASGIQEFRVVGDTLIVTHTEIKPETLKRGETVMIRSPEKPGADASVQASLIAVCARPEVSPVVMGRLLSREKHRKEK